MTELKIKSFARYSDSDELGKFHWDGQVVAVDKKAENVTLFTAAGEMTVPAENCKTINKPKGFDNLAKLKADWRRTNVEKEPVAKKTIVRKKRDGGPTKRDQAIELLKNNASLSRKDAIALFCDSLGMTPADASTYYAVAKKELSK